MSVLQRLDPRWFVLVNNVILLIVGLALFGLQRDATQIVSRISGDASQASRTWVLLTEAAEGGWGIAGTAFGREEFAALAAKKK